MGGWSARRNGFHGGLECGITSLHGALALEIDYSLQSFRGLLAILLQVMEEGGFSRRINTCDISFLLCRQGNSSHLDRILLF